MSEAWNLRITITGYYGEVELVQDAPNGNSATRDSMVAHAIKLYNVLKEGRDGKPTTT